MATYQNSCLQPGVTLYLCIEIIIVVTIKLHPVNLLNFCHFYEVICTFSEVRIFSDLQLGKMWKAGNSKILRL